MDIRDRRGLKNTAAEALQKALPDYRKLVLQHAAVLAGASLILAILNTVLEYGIGSTGGISGMGLRGVLTAIQSFLSTAVTFVLPFWQLGLIFTGIRTARGQSSNFSTLTQGFRRVGPLLRLMLLRLVLYFAVGMACANLSSIFSLFFPTSDAAAQALLTAQEQLLADPEAVIDPALLQVVLLDMIPVLILTLLLYGVVCIHLEYRFRFANYLALDEVKVGAIRAVQLSNFITKGSKWQLFKLDLSLWWYYALQIVLTVICLGNLYLPGGAVTYWVCYVVYLAGTLVLAWFAEPYIQTVYATAYDRLRQKLIPPEEQEI